MSRFKKSIFFVFTFFLFTFSCSAARKCDIEEQSKLNSEAVNIKANYEIRVRRFKVDNPPDELLGTPEADDYYAETDYFQINILNLTENMYAKVTNDYDDTELIYNYSDTKNGNVAIEWNYVMELTKFKIEIYSSDATGCEDSLLRTLYVSLPRYNDYSTYAVCEKVPDYYLCQRYVTYEHVDFSDFEKKIKNEIAKVEEEKKEEEENNIWYNKLLNFLDDNKVIIISIAAVVIVGAVVVVIMYKRRGDKNEKNN